MPEDLTLITIEICDRVRAYEINRLEELIDNIIKMGIPDRIIQQKVDEAMVRNVMSS
jgi:hypothetical protein